MVMRRKHTPGCPCCDEAQTCADLIAKTLYLTDANGTHTLTFDAIDATRWYCCYTLTGVAHTTASTSGCNDETGTIRVAYQFRCHTFSPAGGAALATASLTLDYYCHMCDGFSDASRKRFTRNGTCSLKGGTYLDTHNIECPVVKNSQTDSPFLASFTIPSAAPSGNPYFASPTPFQGSVTISE
jgi:hypothetical protein